MYSFLDIIPELHLSILIFWMESEGKKNLYIIAKYEYITNAVKTSNLCYDMLSSIV